MMPTTKGYENKSATTNAFPGNKRIFSKKPKPSKLSKSAFSYVQSVSSDLHQTIESLDQIEVRSHKRSYCKSLKLARSHWKLKRFARALWNYCQNISTRYESINSNLEFPVFPERCGRLTHLSAQIWILTFAIKDISTEIKQSNETEDLSRAFANLLQEGVLTKRILRNFTSKFLSVTFAAMGRLTMSTIRVEMNLTGRQTITREPKFVESEKPIRDFVLTGSKVEAEGFFDNLRLYMRTNDKRKWFRFGSKSNGNRLQIIVKGFEEATATLHTIRTQLLALNDYMDLPDSCFHETLSSITIKIAKEVNKMLDLADGMMFSSIAQVGNTVQKCGTLINSLQLNGKKFVSQVLEVVTMTRICFKFVVDGLQIPLKTMEIHPLLTSEDEHDEWDYEITDFYKTGYPDILRKVPVIINQNELSLHKHIPTDGY